MLSQFLPRRVDNAYGGHPVALWLFALTLLVKVAMSLNVIFNGHVVAQTADGIPLDTFALPAARAVISMFAAWGLAQLAICLLCIVALVRYRTLVPFLFALLLLEHLGRRLIFLLMPVVRTGSPPGTVVNLALLAILIVGLALSLRWRRTGAPAEAP